MKDQLSLEELARWLWDYIPVAHHCNPLSVPPSEAETIIARFAWNYPTSSVGQWYRQASENDLANFRDFWYRLCASLR